MKMMGSSDQFEEQFESEIQEGLFLVKHNMGKGSKASRDSKFYLTGTRYLAWIDCGNDELYNSPGGLRLRYKPGIFSNFHDFDGPGIYRVQFRTNKTRPTDHLIVKIKGKANDPRLSSILEEYRKPVIVTNELGTFELDRDYNEYKGTVVYLGKEIPVSLEVKEATTDAEMQFERLRQICADQGSFDAKIREYIAEDETLWDWLDDEDTEHDGFEQKLEGPTLVIDENGETAAWFDGGEPFGYHSIVVSIDKDDTCTGIDLVG